MGKIPKNKDTQPYRGKRRMLLEALANADNAELGIEALCRTAGISKPIYYKYIGEPEFQIALRAIMTRNYARFAPQIGNSMVKQAKRGNVKAAQLIFNILQWVDVGNRQTVNVVNTPGAEPTYVDDPADALAMLEAEAQERQAMIEQLRAQVRERVGKDDKQ